MIDRQSEKPSGFGRVISDNSQWSDDGQFKDGDWHGYVRCFDRKGNYEN